MCKPCATGWVAIGVFALVTYFVVRYYKGKQ